MTRLDVDADAVLASAAVLSDAEHRRADRFVFDRDRNRFIVARAGLRKLLAERLAVAPESIEFEYGIHGKPALAGGDLSAPLGFNLSHSEDLAAYAFSSGNKIGIDIEFVRELRDADEIAARFFSSRENESYLALEPRDKPLGFFNCWTRKEAFIKALGDGLHYPLDRFDVSLAPGEPARILSVEDVAGEACGWTLHDLGLESGTVGAVVVNDRVSRHIERPLTKKVSPEKVAPSRPDARANIGGMAQ